MMLSVLLFVSIPVPCASLSIRGKFQQLWDGYPDFHAYSCPPAMEAVAPQSPFCNSDVQNVALGEGQFFRVLDGCPPSISGRDADDSVAAQEWPYYNDEEMEEKCEFAGAWTRLGSSCATRVSVALAHANVPLPRNGNARQFNTGDTTWWTPFVPAAVLDGLNGGYLMVNAAALREAEISDLFTDPKTIWEYDGEWIIDLGRRKPKMFINQMPEVRKMFNNKAGLICWEYQWIKDGAYKGTGHCDIYNGYIRQSAGHDDAWGARRVHSVTLVEDVDYRPTPPDALSAASTSSCRTSVRRSPACLYERLTAGVQVSTVDTSVFEMKPHASSLEPYGCAQRGQPSGDNAFEIAFCHASPVPEWRFTLTPRLTGPFSPADGGNVLEFTVTNNAAASDVVPTELRVAFDVSCAGSESAFAVSTARTYPAVGETITYRIPLDGTDWLHSTDYYGRFGSLTNSADKVAFHTVHFILTAPDAGEWRSATTLSSSTATISNIRFTQRTTCSPVYMADHETAVWGGQYFSYCSDGARLSHFEGVCVDTSEVNAAGTDGVQAEHSAECAVAQQCVTNELSPCNEIIKDPHRGDAESCAGLIPLGNGGETLCHAAPVKVRSSPCGAVVYMMPPPAITGVELGLIATYAVERCGQLWYPVSIPSQRQVYIDPHTGVSMSSDVPADEPTAEELDELTTTSGIGYVLASQVHRCDGYLPAPSSFDEVGEDDEIPCIACMDPDTGAVSNDPAVCSMQPGVCTTIEHCDDAAKFLSSKVIEGTQIVGGCQNLPGPVRCCLSPTEASVSCPWCRADSTIADDSEGSSTLIIAVAASAALCACALCAGLAFVAVLVMRRRRVRTKALVHVNAGSRAPADGTRRSRSSSSAGRSRRASHAVRTR